MKHTVRMDRRAALAAACAAALIALVGPAARAAGKEENRVDFAMVLLERAWPADGADIVADYGKRWKPLAIKVDRTEDEMVVLDLGDTLAQVRLERKPVERLDKVVQASWQWPGARAAADRHAAHLVIEVAALGKSPLENHTRLTRVVASVVAVARPRAVFWPSAAMLVEPATFLSKSASLRRGELPALLCVNFLPQFLGKKPVVHTVGLGELGFLDMILIQGPASDEDAIDRIMRAAELVLRKKQSPRRGKPLELGAGETLTVDEMQAPWDPQKVAVVLELKSKTR
jgi:hypothetical protein